MIRVWQAGGTAVVLAAAATTPAFAQTMDATTASFNTGYGRTVGQENRAVQFSSLDANANLTVVNGIIGGSKQSDSGSEISSLRGFGSASAIGNQLNVIVQGDHNTVVVSSNQTNSGAITATTKVDNTSVPATTTKGSQP
ncbi:MAG: HfaA protein [Caulobacteraceae bacterium]|nr:HfaA protein [Caulobacteraceae bacterium]